MIIEIKKGGKREKAYDFNAETNPTFEFYKDKTKKDNMVYIINSDKIITDIIDLLSKGDTLSAIAKRFGVSVSDIAKKNNIKNVNLINIGQKLLIK